MADREREEERQGGVGLLEKEDQKVQKPRKYKVLLHNDDFTPIEWVASMIQQVFRKSETEAIRITLQIHETGIGLAGIYTHEIAETKVATVLALAKRDEHPLMATMEPE